jgi:hypothetical protein
MPEEFLNPKSMLTPGVAGAMAMLIANTIGLQFRLIEPWPAVVALIVSFLVGLLVMATGAMPYWQRLIYYVLNSLVIFTVAVGSNTVGQTRGSSQSEHKEASYTEQLVAPLASAGIPAAHAQSPSTNGWCCLNRRVNPSSSEECKKWGGQFFSTQEEAQRACQLKEPGKQQKDGGFFRPWFKTR